MRADLGKKQAIEKPVALWDMDRGNADTAGFFSADKDIFIEHEFRDMLEADGSPVQRKLILRAHLLDHGSDRKTDDDSAFFLPDFDKIFQKQAENHLGAEKISEFVDCADTVGIAIGD